MHGARGGEDYCNRRRHMWPVPPPAPATLTTAGAPQLTPFDDAAGVPIHTAPGCFLKVKDGRKIQVGDCALFQAGNAPPFIGIIRWFSTSKEEYLKLCVNWLYRPADVKLAKGVLLESAPNEVFYSFHKDVISAASLLHPCKVAFLRKGVELPTGICSFVCRRVYDIENKCLWWLTDQDYINERQEEVDQLLDKTRLEMHAVQQGGRSPKPLNGPAATQQLKSGSDSVQNSGPSFPSQGKGKKRDRGEQGTEPIKRERSKTEDADYASSRPDSLTKAELAKMSEKGGLLTLEEVEKLVNLMQHDRAERKLDLAGRVLLANVIAATDKQDCLGKFVQLWGVPVLDDWLQEVHKGKTGDSSSPRESDKAVEDLVLALLRALDKLPVNLNALQTCNIGKSVNNLRSHKNLEIQKKARSLVDTWKKRVDLEIKTHEAKSAGSGQPISWPSKSGLSDVPHAGSRRAGSTEILMKSSITQPSACRTQPGKAGHIDVVKSTPVIPGSVKLPSSMPTSMAVGLKDTLLKAAGGSGTLELPVKEEKSSSSSQSQNNSQSCSSDHAKTIGSLWKEDARSSTAGSVNASKSSGGSSRHRRSSNGYLGTSISGSQKEANLGKSGSHNRTTTLDKVSQGGMTCERTLDMPVQDHGSGHKFILRLPNIGRGLGQNGGGGSFEDPSFIQKRASSPGTADKLDSSDRKIKEKSEASRSHNAMDMNTESWQSNDIKERLAGSDEGDQSPTAIPDEEHRGSNDMGKAADVTRPVCSPSGNEKVTILAESKTRNSFSSMHALIESCVNYSEHSAPLAAGDDLGMNLLATVAAGEMSIESPGMSPAMEDPCAGSNDSKSKLQVDDVTAPSLVPSAENTDVSEKDANIVGSVLARDEFQVVGTDFSVDKRSVMRTQENSLPREQNGQHPASSKNTEKAGDSCMKFEVKVEGADRSVSSLTLSDMKEEFDRDESNQYEDKRNTGGQVPDSSMECKPMTKSSTLDENKSLAPSHEKIAEENMHSSDFIHKPSLDECHNDTDPSGRKPEKLIVSEPVSCSPVDTGMQNGTTAAETQAPVVENHSENVNKVGDDTSGIAGTDLVESADSKARNSDILLISQLDADRNEPATLDASSVDGDPGAALTSDENVIGAEMTLESKEALENHPAGSVNHESSSIRVAQYTDNCSKSSTSKLSAADTDGDELASSAETSPKVVTFERETVAKLDFDLNEGIPGDDGNHSELATSTALGCSTSIHLPFATSPTVNGSPAMVTVAAPAKGPFVPPENLLKSKAEPGWKGSAATSAFRPAEPRRILEIPLTTDLPTSDTGSGKHGRIPLDIDLNIADDRVLEDMASQSSAQTTGSESGIISNRDASVRSAGGLDLDLNRVDEGTDNGHPLTSTSRRFDMPLLPVKPTLSGFHGGEANLLRNFDLNNGPGIDEVGIESLGRSQHAKNTSVPFLPPVAGFRMNNAEFGSVPSWLPPGNSYPAVTIPSFLPDRGEHPYPIVAAAGAQRILGSVSGGSTFAGDLYRGPVLSSSPAMAFSPATAFPYAGFPFGSGFPVASTSFSSTTYIDSSSAGGSCYPAIPSQLVGPAGAISSHYSRPYMLGLPEGSTTGAESSRKWSRPGLDLNAGPGSTEMEAKDDRLSAASRQFSVSNSQAFIEEQMRIYQAAGGGLKRKEPEGGLDTERYAYKQHSWQ